MNKIIKFIRDMLIKQDILIKDSQEEKNKYFFGEYLPIVISKDDKKIISANRCNRDVYITFRKDGETCNTKTSYDSLIDQGWNILGIINDSIGTSSIYKVGDKLLLGTITEFPIVNKILKVKIDEDIYDLEILNNEVPPILTTEDNFRIYDISEEVLFIFNTDKLNYKELKPLTYDYLSLLNLMYNGSYVIFKSRERLKEFIEEYMKNTDD